MWDFLGETLRILNESSIYLLIGFAFAGFGNVYLSRHANVGRRLARGGLRSVFLASIYGLPLPLCSCSVLPAGMALRKRGASKGATASFLISVPETDVISIVLTWGLLGPIFAILRPLAALITAICTGLMVDIADRGAANGSIDDTERSAPVADEGNGRPPVVRWLRRSLDFGFVKIFDDLIGQLLLGIFIAGMVAALLPDLRFLEFARSSPWSYLIMLGVGIPTYVCATAATPIAAGLIAGGISPGAALVFLLAGPATNTASLLVLGRAFGRAAMAAYLLPIAVVSVGVGVGVDALLGGLPIPVVAAVAAAAASPSVIEIFGTILLAYLVIKSAQRTGALDRFIGRLGNMLGVTVSPRTGKAGLTAAALLLYLSSGLFTVGPGERGIVKEFGRITKPYLAPGLHYRYPPPFGSRDIVPVHKIRSVEYGVRRAAAPAPEPGLLDDPSAEEGAETWLLAGDENLVDAQCVIHYQVRDTEEDVTAFLYGVHDAEGLVRSGVEWALATAVASRGIDSLLTVEREAMETTVRKNLLQEFLDACKSGIRIVDVNLLEVHAPRAVHWWFRDVASAAEDRVQRVNMAREYRERVTREARGQASSLVSEAHGLAAEDVAIARGEGRSFVLQAGAYREDPRTTTSRLYLEWMDRFLPDLTKYVDVTGENYHRLELWLGKGTTGPPFTPRSPRTPVTPPEGEVQ